MQFRQCFVYVKTPIDVALVKKGDIYSYGKRSPEDNWNESCLFVADEDATPTLEIDGQYGILSHALMPTDPTDDLIFDK